MGQAVTVAVLETTSAKPPRKLASWRAEKWVTVGLLAFLLPICGLPMGRLLYALLAAVLGPHRDAVLAAAHSSAAWTATLHSLQVGLMGGAIAAGYGLLMATIVTLGDLRHRPFVVFGFVVQAMIPPQVIALAWLQVWIPAKDMLQAVGLEAAQSWGNPLQGGIGISFLLGVHYAPLVFLTVRAALLNVPADVIEAARVCGSPPLKVVTRIVWPLILPALVSGAALAFVSCIGNFGIPALLGIPGDYLVLPTLIYRELSGYGPSVIPNVVILSGIVAALSGLGVLVQRLCVRGEHYRVSAVRRTDTQHAPFRFQQHRLWVELVSGGLVTLLLVVPLLALMAQSLTPAPGVPLNASTVTLAHYAYVLLGNEATSRAFFNSALLAVATAVVLAVVSLFYAYMVEYRRVRVLSKFGFLIEVPYVIPGVVLAMAMILLYLRPLPMTSLSLYNTLAILLLAYLARFLTIQLRPVLSGFRQFPREMLEAAEIFGAHFRLRMQKIVLPQLLPSLTAGATLVVLLAMNELTVSALLWATGTETLGVAVFSLEQGGESAAASALAMLTVACTVLVMCAANMLGRRLPSGVLPWRA